MRHRNAMSKADELAPILQAPSSSQQATLKRNRVGLKIVVIVQILLLVITFSTWLLLIHLDSGRNRMSDSKISSDERTREISTIWKRVQSLQLPQRQASVISEQLPSNRPYKQLKLYYAGDPRFQSVFFRDTVVSALFMPPSRQRTEMLLSILQLAVATQGQKQNPITGEEPGRIFHEVPGVDVNGFNTLFAAADTTALFVIGMHDVWKSNQYASLITVWTPELVKAVSYIMHHIDERGMFIEDPKFAGASKYALKGPYWKDSFVGDRINGELSYPVTFSVAQAAAIRALRCAEKMLPGSFKVSDLSNSVDRMLASLMQQLFDSRSGSFYLGVDAEGVFGRLTSDTLHILWYLQPGDISQANLDRIEMSSLALLTPAGFASESTSSDGIAQYDGIVVRPVEQAIIHSAATTFGLRCASDGASQVVSFLSSDLTAPEYLAPASDGYGFVAAGCRVQLCTMAAAMYFESTLDNGLSWISTSRIRGADLSSFEAAIVYCQKGLNFTCDSGSINLGWDRVNDDFCDCKDGRDEVGTSACSHLSPKLRFHCRRGDQTVPTSLVDDGICDCGDCSDEDAYPTLS